MYPADALWFISWSVIGQRGERSSVRCLTLDAGLASRGYLVCGPSCLAPAVHAREQRYYDASGGKSKANNHLVRITWVGMRVEQSNLNETLVTEVFLPSFP